jgi:hypothetical protein
MATPHVPGPASEGWVWAVHPESDQPCLLTEESLRDFWSLKGWVSTNDSASSSATEGSSSDSVPAKRKAPVHAPKSNKED